MTAIRAVDGNRKKPKYHPTAAQKDTIERRFRELGRRLELKTGSPINPDSLGYRLQAMVEDRLVLPGDQWISGFGYGSHYRSETIPLPAPLWYKLTQHSLLSSGITHEAHLSLAIRLGINTLGDLILHTAEEISSRCGEWVTREAEMSLDAMAGLRLPTSEELEATRESGFWTELEDNYLSGGPHLRVAVCMLDFYSHHEINFGDINSFLDRIGIDSLGALLKMTPEQIKAAFVADDKVRYPQFMRLGEESYQKEAERKFGYLLDWATASGLKFAS